MRRFLIVIACLVFAGMVLLILAPTVIVGLEGGFKAQQVSFELSPTGDFELIITKRTAFPANEFVDPSIVIRAQLRDAASHHVTDTAEIRLAEDSDFTSAAIEWGTNEVRVSKFDRRKSQALTLKHQPNGKR